MRGKSLRFKSSGEPVGGWICWAGLWYAVRVLDILESGGEARKLEGWLWMGRLSSAILRRLFAEVCGYLVLEGQERVLHRL